MVAIIIVLLITILIVAQFYLKNGALASFAALIAAIVALIVAFGFYEFLGGLFLSNGFMSLKINGVAFLVLFILSYAILHVINGFLVGSSIEFGRLADILAAIICGTITGLIISGCVLVGFNLASLSSTLSYKRFDGTISQSSINDPKKSFLRTDDFVAGLFNLVSRGSMSGKRSFSQYHPDFNSQIHLNRHLIKDGVISVSESGAVSIPKLGVREKETGEGTTYTAIRVEIKAAKIDKGGAADKDGRFAFAPFQMRLICQSDEVAGARGVKVLYPEDVKVYKGKPINMKAEFGNAITLNRDVFIASGSKSLVVMDLAFNIPSNVKPVLFEFKNTAVTEVPPLTRDEEAEEKLNEIFKSKKDTDGVN